MVKMTGVYTGGLHCKLTHGPSQSLLETDAPKDNMGQGEKFSPTDLVGAALLSCILTTMAIVAERDGVSLVGATGSTTKDMISTPNRKIGALRTQITLPKSIPLEYRPKLERVAHNCPVHRSLSPEIEAPIEFGYV